MTSVDRASEPIAQEPDEVLRKRLLTCDGRGVAYKTVALDELIRRASEVRPQEATGEDDGLRALHRLYGAAIGNPVYGQHTWSEEATRDYHALRELRLRSTAPAAARGQDLLAELEEGCWDLRCHDSSGDGDVWWTVIEHYMAEPRERTIGGGATPAEAIRSAIAGGFPERYAAPSGTSEGDDK